MPGKPKIAPFVITLCAAMSLAGAALAAAEQNLKAGEAQAKQLLLLMDKDQNGKVSKQEFMSFMEAEFARLDKDKSGELDVNELTAPQLSGFGRGAPHR